MIHTHLSSVPRMSEKTSAESLKSNNYVFTVSPTANKQQIAAAVAEQYNVTVENVRTMVQKGKVIRTVRKGKVVPGQRPNVKKAYVTLKEGDKLDVFAEMEAESEEAK